MDKKKSIIFYTIYKKSTFDKRANIGWKWIDEKREHVICNQKQINKQSKGE